MMWLAWNSLNGCGFPGLLGREFITQGNMQDDLSFQGGLLHACHKAPFEVSEKDNQNNEQGTIITV